MSEGTIVMRHQAIKAQHYKNILATVACAPSRSTTPEIARTFSSAPQAIVSNRFSFLPNPIYRSSLSRCGAVRAQTGIGLWRHREEQQSKSFACSPTRPPSRRCLLPLRPTRAWSTWSASWRDRRRGILFKPKRMDGSTTASPNKEAAV